MIRIGIKEFRYQFNNWLGALAIFIAASLVSSSCLIIYFPLAPVVPHSEVTNALFITPLSFGLVTLFVVISGVIGTIGKALAKEHARLAQLGSNPAQLAQITAVQMVLVSSLGTLIGYFVALPLAQEMYHLIQNEAGKAYIPSIVINYQLNSFCAVWGLTLIITYVSSFLYSYHTLVKMKNIKQHRFLKILKTVLFGIVVMLTISGILWEYYQIYFATKDIKPTDTFQLLLFLTAALVWLVGNHLIKLSLRLIYYGVRKLGTRTLNTAFYRVNRHSSRLTTLIKPFLIALLLLSGILHLVLELLNMQRVRSLTGVFLVLLIYFGPTLIIVAGNMISLTIMERNIAKQDFTQLRVLGYSPGDILLEQIQEGALYSLTAGFLMAIFNLLFFAAIRFVKNRVFDVAYFSLDWISVLYWPILASTACFILVFLLGSVRVKAA